MRKEETLRGRGSFQFVVRSGKRVDGEVLRCFFRWDIGAGTPVRAGFSVSAKKYNAVKRNRARRIMRASFELEKDLLVGSAMKSGGRLTVLFVFRGRRDAPKGQPGFEGVRKDIAMLCGKIGASMDQEHP